MTKIERREPSPKIQEVSNEVGVTYRTNNCGDVVVLEYPNSKKILIQFVNSGNIQIVQKDALEKGLIRDRVQDEIDLAIKKEQLASEINEKAQRRAQLKLDEIARTAEAKRLHKLEVVERERKRREDAIKTRVGDSYTNRFGQIYTIKEILSYDRCVVEFTDGHTVETTRKMAANSKCFNKTCPDFKEKRKIEEVITSKKWYLNNKERANEKAVRYKELVPESVVNSRTPRRNIIKEDGKITDAEKNQILKDQDCKCVYCKIELTEDNMQEDHILPFKLGGRNVVSNLQFLCQPCNSSKGSKHPDYFLKLLENDEYRKLVFGDKFKPFLSN